MVDTRRKQKTDELCVPDNSQSLLFRAERSVLSVFRKYLMTPGKMLCISGSDLKDFNVPLARLSDKGLLVAESFQGGYSLTEAGFAAMKDGQ